MRIQSEPDEEKQVPGPQPCFRVLRHLRTQDETHRQVPGERAIYPGRGHRAAIAIHLCATTLDGYEVVMRFGRSVRNWP